MMDPDPISIHPSLTLGVIIEKARAMRIAANLLHDLWDEIINYAVYL